MVVAEAPLAIQGTVVAQIIRALGPVVERGVVASMQLLTKAEMYVLGEGHFHSAIPGLAALQPRITKEEVLVLQLVELQKIHI
jgi:hypothetical protein